MSDKTTTLAVTKNISERLDGEARGEELKKEALSHAIFVLALTDNDFLDRAKRLCEYLGNLGADALASKGL